MELQTYGTKDLRKQAAKSMKGKKYMIAVGLISLMSFAGCSKDETVEEPSTTD